MDTSKIRKGLGRGLSSLIGETKTEKNTTKVLIGDLTRNKYQPRKNFDSESLQDLTNSIKERGIIQPIIVRRSEQQNNKYEIIAGERRWIAAQKAGLHEVPVVVTQADDLKSLEFAIVENVQRHDLNAVEEAQGYQKLINDYYSGTSSGRRRQCTSTTGPICAYPGRRPRNCCIRKGRDRKINHILQPFRRFLKTGQESTSDRL